MAIGSHMAVELLAKGSHTVRLKRAGLPCYWLLGAAWHFHGSLVVIGFWEPHGISI